MTELIAGCMLRRPPGPEYARRLRFAELSVRIPLPRLQTMRRWRSGLPEGFGFALSAPRSSLVSGLGPFRPDDLMESALQWTLQAADVIDAAAVVLATPVEFTPSRRDRDRFAAFADRLPRSEDRLWVWAPGGVWETEEAFRFAEKLGLVCAFDPLTSPPPGGELLYARIVGLGTRRRLSEAHLSDLLETLANSGAKRAYVAFDTEKSFEHALFLSSARPDEVGLLDPYQPPKLINQ